MYKIYPPQSYLMEKSCDRIGELPDGILDSILSLLPMKYAIRTSILSKRWRNRWKYTLICATTLDFGKEFAKAQTQQQCVSTVSRYLQLHNRNKIENFRLYFQPGDQYQTDVEKWIEFAILKGVKELDLIFCPEIENYFYEDENNQINLPDILFGCDSLIHLSSSHVKFNLPSDFTGFASLVTLRLNQVYITDETIESLLLNCPVLSNLSIRQCFSLRAVRVSGPNLQLKSLTLLATYASEVDIFAPNLKSLHFHGPTFYGYSFRNIAALEDVFISADGYEHCEPEHNYIQILSGMSNIKILTMCTAPPMCITIWEEFNPEGLPITLSNLQELQILIGGQIGEEYLGYVFGFFKLTICPCLEKLFIDLTGPWRPNNATPAEEPSSCFFYSLLTVKINHFRGSDTEMKMVKFFLDRAVVLESLILVAAVDSHTQKDENTSQSETCMRPTKILLDQLLILPKASKDAQILLVNQGEVDTSLCPFHTYTDYYLEGICCN